jgi:hypothetical protein
MRTYLLLLCLTGLLLKSFTGRSQRLQRPYSIQLSAHNSTSGTDFRVNVTRRVDAIYLRYGRLDSMQHGRLRADPRYSSYVSELQANPLPTAGTRTAKRLLALVVCGWSRGITRLLGNYLIPSIQVRLRN